MGTNVDLACYVLLKSMQWLQQRIGYLAGFSIRVGCHILCNRFYMRRMARYLRSFFCSHNTGMMLSSWSKQYSE